MTELTTIVAVTASIVISTLVSWYYPTTIRPRLIKAYQEYLQ